MGWHCPVPVGCLAVAPETCSAGGWVASLPFPLLAARGSPWGEARGPGGGSGAGGTPGGCRGAGLVRFPEGCTACGRTCGISREQRVGEGEGAAPSVPLPPCRGTCGGGGTTVQARVCRCPQARVAMGGPEPSAPTSRCLPCLEAGAGGAGREGHSPGVSGLQLRRFAGAGDREQTGPRLVLSLLRVRASLAAQHPGGTHQGSGEKTQSKGNRRPPDTSPEQPVQGYAAVPANSIPPRTSQHSTGGGHPQYYPLGALGCWSLAPNHTNSCSTALGVAESPCQGWGSKPGPEERAGTAVPRTPAHAHRKAQPTAKPRRNFPTAPPRYKPEPGRGSWGRAPPRGWVRGRGAPGQ